MTHRSSGAKGRLLGERKQQVTRDALLDAAVQAIRDVGLDFSMQDVADRAGLSHRTVYRYFETREALLDAVTRWEDARVVSGGGPEPTSLDEWVTGVVNLFQVFDRDAELIRAGVLLELARDERAPSRIERTARLQGLFEAEFPHLDADEVAGAFAVVRLLGGSSGWLALSSQRGLSGAESGQAVSRAMRAIVADLRRRDRAAARRDDRGTT